MDIIEIAKIIAVFIIIIVFLQSLSWKSRREVEAESNPDLALGKEVRRFIRMINKIC